MSTQSPASSNPKEQFILRFPSGMREHLKMLAASNRRSMNAELLQLIEKGMGLTDTVSLAGVGEQKFTGGGQSMA
jgi:hypothetical protein